MQSAIGMQSGIPSVNAAVRTSEMFLRLDVLEFIRRKKKGNRV